MLTSPRKVVSLAQSGRVATITIERPEKRNALSIQAIDELLDAINEAQNSTDVRVIILTGAGDRAFAAGVDLDEVPEAFSSPAKARAYDDVVTALYDAMSKCRLPIIARIQGHAIGGGCLLALACDIRVASSDIKVAFPVAKIGLMLSPAEYQLILDHVGPSTAKLLLFTARLLLAEEARSCGLLDWVVERESLDSVVSELASSIALGAPRAIASSKAILNAMASNRDLAGAVDQAYESVYSSSDLIEGMDAIRSRRAPIFQGK